MTTQVSPANKPANAAPERKRIPMSIPRRKLEVPDLPGYFLYWHLESDIPAALQAGYEFVDSKEVAVNQRGVANSAVTSGNADLGSQVRVVAGRSENGHVEYHVLMKLRQEWRDEDQKLIDERNASIMGAIFKGEQVMDGDRKVSEEDKRTRYVKTALFQRPARK